MNALEAAEENPSFTNLLAVRSALDLGLDIAESAAVQQPTIVHPDLDELVNRHRSRSACPCGGPGTGTLP